MNDTGDRIDREQEMLKDFGPFLNFPPNMELDEVEEEPGEGKPDGADDNSPDTNQLPMEEVESNDEGEVDDDKRDPDYQLHEQDSEEDDWDVGGAQAPPIDPRGAWNRSPHFDPLPAAPPTNLTIWYLSE